VSIVLGDVICSYVTGGGAGLKIRKVRDVANELWDVHAPMYLSRHSEKVGLARGIVIPSLGVTDYWAPLGAASKYCKFVRSPLLLIPLVGIFIIFTRMAYMGSNSVYS